MGKKKRQREQEDREDRERIWKKLKSLEEFLQRNIGALCPSQDTPCASGTDPLSEHSGVAEQADNREVTGSVIPAQQGGATGDLPAGQSDRGGAAGVLSAVQSVNSGHQAAQQAVGGASGSGLIAGPGATVGSVAQLSPAEAEPAEPIIDAETRRILGEDPRAEEPNVGVIHSELAARWSSWIAGGLKKEIKDELLLVYPRAENCLLGAQVLNPEVAATLQESALKRDKFAAETQNLTGSAMLALGLGISLMLNENGEEGIDMNLLLEYLCDAGKLLAEAHHHEALTRRSFILPGMEKNVKDILEKSTMDKYLFGDNLGEKIKSAKSIEKVASDLKPKAVRKVPARQTAQLNWKAPPSRGQGTPRVGRQQFANVKFSKVSPTGRPRQELKYPTAQRQTRSRYTTDSRRKQ